MYPVRALPFETIKHMYDVLRTGVYVCHFPHDMKFSFIPIAFAFRNGNLESNISLVYMNNLAPFRWKYNQKCNLHNLLLLAA